MSDLIFQFRFNGATKDIPCQFDEIVNEPLSKFAKFEKKNLQDFAFYYKSSLIKDSEYKIRINDSIFGESKSKKFVIFATHLRLEESKEKKTEEKNTIIIEEKKEAKEVKKEEKEEKKKEFYYDIVCPECKTSAIIDINKDKNELGLKILNCENFHNLNYKTYDIYEELDLDRIPLFCDICSTFLTPPENKLYYCACGSKLCSECEKNHNDESLNEKGHFKIEYKEKNYFCFKHGKPEKFNSYCIDYNANICEKCEKSHPSESHEIHKFSDIKPTNDDIEKWKGKYEQHQKKLTKFISSIKETFNNMVNTVESNLNSYILIEKTLIKRYKDGFENFQLLRNLTNENIFTNSLFDKLEKHSDEKMIVKKKLEYLNKLYEQIIELKKGEETLSSGGDSDGKISIGIVYKIEEKNPINRYVKLFDEVFIKNNSEKISVTINGKVLPENKLKAYYNNVEKKEKLEVNIKEKGKSITDLSYMLNNCKNVASVNFKNWDNSKVTSMEAMFQLTNLNKIPEELFRSQNPNLTNIKAMFCKCVNITGIPDLNKLFYTDNNIKDISMLFNGCKKLTIINGKSWNANNLTDMSYVFNRCEALKEIHLGKDISTNNVKSLCGLFNGCTNLEKIPSTVEKWNIQNVEDISIMFQGCNKIKKISIGNYNVSNVKDMSGLFSRCSNLNTINSFKNWSPNKVKEMIGMFNECKKLNTIEVGKWNLTKVSNASGMFYKCEGLKNLKNGDYLFRFNDKNNKTNIENIFDQSGIEDKQKIKDAWESTKK